MKIKFLSILILSFIIFLSFSSNILAEVNKNNEILIEGIDNYYSENYTNAIDKFEVYLNNNDSIDQLYIDALYYQTLSLIKNKEVSKANNNVIKLKDFGYEFAKIYWYLGQVYLNKDGHFASPMYEEAKNNFEKASMLGIDSAKFHGDLAKAYSGLKLYDKAIKEYELAIKGDVDSSIYINLAKLYQNDNNYNKALNIYNEYLEMEDGSVSIYTNISEIYLAQEKYERAIENLEKAIEINENHFSIHYQLAKIYYNQGKIDLAKGTFEKVITLNENNYMSYYYLGKIHEKDKNIEKAKYFYEQAIRFNNNYADAYIDLGQVYLNEDNVYKAISNFSSAVESNPQYAKAHFYLAKAFIKRNMKEAAITELRETLHLDNNYDEARELLDKLLEE